MRIKDDELIVIQKILNILSVLPDNRASCILDFIRTRQLQESWIKNEVPQLQDGVIE